MDELWLPVRDLVSVCQVENDPQRYLMSTRPLTATHLYAHVQTCVYPYTCAKRGKIYMHTCYWLLSGKSFYWILTFDSREIFFSLSHAHTRGPSRLYDFKKKKRILEVGKEEWWLGQRKNWRGEALIKTLYTCTKFLINKIKGGLSSNSMLLQTFYLWLIHMKISLEEEILWGTISYFYIRAN